MDHSGSEQNPTDLRLSDLKKVHKTSSEIVSELSEESDEKKAHSTIQQRRKLIRKAWNKLIPRENEHKKEVVQAIQAGEIDPLTRLGNRTRFKKNMDAEVARITREQINGNPAYATVLYLDLNDFGKLNNTKGHSAGDEALMDVADALQKVARLTDSVARLGGDEFAVLLSNMSMSETQTMVSERLMPLFEIKGIKSSIGAALFEPENPDLSVKKADAAMYSAKKTHKRTHVNEFRVYSREELDRRKKK